MAEVIKKLACVGTTLVIDAKAKTSMNVVFFTLKECFGAPEIFHEHTKKSIKFTKLKLLNKGGFIR